MNDIKIASNLTPFRRHVSSTVCEYRWLGHLIHTHMNL